jgi:hypothetical protein
MKASQFLATTFCVISACLLLTSCDKSTEPIPELLSSFSLTVPGTVTAGEAFNLTVSAVGSEGTQPFPEFGGYVVLTASDGSITPDSLLLSGGTGSGTVVLSGQSDTQTITATHGTTSGSVTVNATFMTTLPGNPNDSANEAIPSFEFIADGDDYTDGHPSLSGMYPSQNTIMIAFELGTTIGQANAVLGGINPIIVGGITGEEGVAPGVLFLKLPTTTHSELETVLSTLNANSSVQTAVQDILMSPNSIPAPNDGDPPTWTWDGTVAGANWGLERTRVPQMWDFNQAVAKKMQAEGWPPSTVLIVDNGFAFAHPDINNLFFRPQVIDPHGAHVAGIIGATFNNGKGIDGVCPYVFMMGSSVTVSGGSTPYQDRASAGQAIISGLQFAMRPYVDVVNISLGYNWIDAQIDSDTDITAQNIVTKQAQLLVNSLHLGTLSFRSPLIVVSAGNGSGQGFGDHDARYNSPMCYAAIALGIENILVVEGVMDSPGTAAGDVTRYPSSSINGHISAPGSDVWGTTSEASVYRSRDGTSYAAAVVTGVAAYLNVIEPYLTFLDVKDVLLSTALSSGGGAVPRVDAWASVVDLDRVRGGTGFLSMMCDIDDGTPDGNLRVAFDSRPYFEEDVDQDQGTGDGNIDMSDFRRWRDWFLLCQASNHDLDGDQNHPKNDVNNNGTVEDMAGENVYPRGDFNGDGLLDENSASFVPGAINGEATDLEVFQAVFSDPDYDANDLPGLLYSSDYQIDASFLLTTSSSVYARLMLLPNQDLVASHTFTTAEPVHVFTRPAYSESYRVEVFADNEEFEHGDRDYTLGNGEDAIFKPLAYIPIDPKGTYLHMCGEGANDLVPIRLADYGIKPGDIICLDNEGFHTYSDDPNWGSYDLIGVFSSNSTLLSMSASHRVPGAIDAGNDFTTWRTNGCGGQITDIPEDFAIRGDGEIIEVPAGAAYLFACGHDSGYEDNWAPSGRFGVQISIVKVPDAYIDS